MKALPLTICLLLAANSTAAAVRYQIVDLSALGIPIQFPDSLSLNNAGQVAGPNGLWTPDHGLVPLPFSPTGINDLGQVIGTDDASAFLWTPGHGTNDPGTIKNLGPGYPTGVNNRGAVVGDQYTVHDGYLPWRWTSQGGREALTLDAELPQAATIEINDAGTIIGENFSGAYIYVWTPNSPLGQPFLHPDGQAYGWDLNNLGQIAGQGPDYSPMLYTPGKGFENLGRLRETQGWANSLNEAGQVVGIATNDLDDDLGTAWIWSAGEGILDLNSLIPPQDSDGWFLRGARSINNAGQIVGTGRLGDEESVVFLLNPIPEPSTIAIAVFAFAMIGSRRMRST